VVKIFAFLELEPRLNIKCGFNWAGKKDHFSKVSSRRLWTDNRPLKLSPVNFIGPVDDTKPCITPKGGIVAKGLKKSIQS